MLTLFLLLAASPVDAAQLRLAKELKSELDRHSMELLVGGPNELVLRLAGDVFERADPLWKSLYAVLRESRLPGAPTFRVELKEQPHCVQHRDVARHYLFDKQKADPTRVAVWGRCGADSPDEPSTQLLGPLTVEARKFLARDGAELGGVSVHVSNGGDAGVELTIDALDLFAPGDPVQVRAVPISGVWFRAEGQPLVTVKGKTLTAPPGVIEVMLQFASASAERRTSQRRVRFSVKGERGLVLGPVVPVGFSEELVPGVKR